MNKYRIVDDGKYYFVQYLIDEGCQEWRYAYHRFFGLRWVKCKYDVLCDARSKIFELSEKERSCRGLVHVTERYEFDSQFIIKKVD